LFISDQVNKNLRNLSLLMNVMKMTRAILSSPHLFVEPYVDQSNIVLQTLIFL
jgi:hypothetical protein